MRSYAIATPSAPRLWPHQMMRCVSTCPTSTPPAMLGRSCRNASVCPQVVSEACDAARPGVVLVRHHDVAVGGHVVADMVVPLVVVAVAVTDDRAAATGPCWRCWSGSRCPRPAERTESRDRATLYRTSVTASGPGCGRIVADVQAGLAAESVDIVAAVQHAVAVHVHDHVIAVTHAGVGAGRGLEHRGTQLVRADDLEGVGLNGRAAERHARRAAGGDVDQRRIALPLARASSSRPRTRPPCGRRSPDAASGSMASLIGAFSLNARTYSKYG